MFTKREPSMEALTQELLQKTIEKKNVEALRSVIRYHDWMYYVKSSPSISDFDYDALFYQLKKLEEAHPEIKTIDSPTQRVAQALSDDFPAVSHGIPMLSLDNSYNEEDIIHFDNTVKKWAETQDVEYTIEPKFDGSSISLLYENDTLIRAATRGNGMEGEDITNNARVIRSIPLRANFSQYGIFRAEVRGEVVIRIANFIKMNEEREKEGLSTYQNARNTASGSLRMKSSAEVSKRSLEAFIYQLGIAEDNNGDSLLDESIQTHESALQILSHLGFKVEPTQTAKSAKEILDACMKWESERAHFPYEIDGVVVKANYFSVQKKAGATSHHPRWAIAYKFKAQQEVGRLYRVSYQVGRTGAITPVAKICHPDVYDNIQVLSANEEPEATVRGISLAGVEIKNVSLHNEDFIKEKDIQLGDFVVVERAGDVIPYIVGPVVEKRTQSNPVIFPTKCPSCQSPLFKPEGEAIWRCEYAECPAQAEERLIHFVSKGAMDINGLGKDIVKRFIQEELLQQIEDIYQLDFERISALDGWKEKSVKNLKEGIETSKKQPVWRLLVGLGIRHVGKQTAKILAGQVSSVLDLKDWKQEDFIELEDIGPKVAESIFDFFQTEKNIDLLKKLHALGVNTENEMADIASPEGLLAGKTFLFTGSLTEFTRDEAQWLVEKHGGKNISTVSKKLDYLVVGKNAGSKLKKAEKIESINILSEKAFLDMVNKE